MYVKEKKIRKTFVDDYTVVKGKIDSFYMIISLYT